MTQNAEPKTVLDEMLDILQPSERPKRDMSKYSNGNRGPDERRVDPSDKRTFEVSEMWDVHHEIVRRRLLGQKVVNIAKDLGVSEAMVSYTVNSPVVKDKLEIMKGARDAETIDLAKRIRENAPQSLRLLEDIISGEVDGTVVPLNMRRQEANMMMNRAGFAPVQTIKGAILHGHYTSDEIDEIKKRALEDGLKSGVVVDGEATEINEVE